VAVVCGVIVVGVVLGAFYFVRRSRNAIKIDIIDPSESADPQDGKPQLPPEPDTAVQPGTSMPFKRIKDNKKMDTRIHAN